MICNEVKSCSTKTMKTKEWCNECRSEITDSNIMRRERGKRYNLINPQRIPVIVFKMDGGIVRDEESVPKCDWLYVITDPQNRAVIFVELKGKDIKHALEQIRSSMDSFGKEFKDSRILARIVCGSVPRITNDGELIKIRKYLKKQYNAELDIKENSYDDNYLVCGK